MQVGQIAGTSDRWLRSMRPASTARNQLVLFPHSGGAASYYRAMAELLPAETDGVLVQYPGRQDRLSESPVDSIEGLADHIVASLLPRTGKPMSLYGHSMGAAVAFEVALRLEGLSHRVETLFVSGRPAPAITSTNAMHRLGDDHLIAELARLGGTDPAILSDTEILQIILPAIRADYRASETYRNHVGAVLHCPIVAFAGNDDPYANPGDTASWGDFTLNRFEVHAFPGGHFFIEEQRSRIVDVVRSWMRRSAGAQEPAPGPNIRPAGA